MVKHSRFVHLHLHTDHSFLDGACQIEPLVGRAVEYRMPALAITDHGNMCGAVRFYSQCVKSGIKPVIGCEFYLAPGSRKEKNKGNFHMTLLARDTDGYRNLMKLNELAYRDGFYHKPRIDMQLLEQYSRGLVALTGCLQGLIPRLILENNDSRAFEEAGKLNEIFGAGHLYLEMMRTGIPEQEKVNKGLMRISSRTGIECVATNDCHYINRDDAYAQEILMCVGTGRKIDDPGRLRFSTQEYYLKSPEEMYALFSDYPEAVSNTVKVAEKCNLKLDFNSHYLPEYEVPEGMTRSTYLEKLCREGLRKRYGDTPPEESLSRLESELESITQLGFPGYFLICWDFVNYARESGIPVGPGRGSGAGSIVSYLLGITDIDPLKYGLLFERFLNPDRKTLPDLDIDFADSGRDRVIEYVRQKYGSRRVAQIGTFSTLKARAAFKDVARVLSIPYDEADKVSKMIPDNLTLYRAVEETPELVKVYGSDERIKQALEIAMTIEGCKRQPGVHAAGVVIAPGDLSDYVPRGLSSENRGITQYEGEDLVKLGLLKMDFLGLKNLTVIKKAVENIKETRGEEIDINLIPPEDKKTFELLSSSETLGVFQLESGGFQNLLRKMEITRFEDIVALVALYRPGVVKSGMTEEYIERKNGTKPVEYFDRSVEGILKETYGIVLYQEQVMQIARELGGFTPSQADDMRRAMSKKIPEMLQKLRKEFVSGAAEKGIKSGKADSIFENLSKFGAYGFNKSHSAAYGKITYQTAYLKANYPTEYMCALLTCDQDKTEKVVSYVQECERMGIEVMRPDVNESYADFSIESDKRIRYGLSAVKNVGRAAIDSIISARKKGGGFKTFYGFCSRVDLQKVNKRVVESLIKAGAFDCLGKGRRPLFMGADDAISQAGEYQKDLLAGQESFFDVIDGEKLPEIEISDTREWHENEYLVYEKEVLGFFLSGHPLAKNAGEILNLTSGEIGSVCQSRAPGTPVALGGMVKHSRKVRTRKGADMVVFMLEDLSGKVDSVIFPSVYTPELEALAENDSIVIACGRIDDRKGHRQIIVDRLMDIEEARKELVDKVVLRIDSSATEKDIDEIRRAVERYPGKTLLEFEVDTKNFSRVRIRSGIRARAGNALVEELKRILGNESVRLVGSYAADAA